MFTLMSYRSDDLKDTCNKGYYEDLIPRLYYETRKEALKAMCNGINHLRTEARGFQLDEGESTKGYEDLDPDKIKWLRQTHDWWTFYDNVGDETHVIVRMVRD